MEQAYYSVYMYGTLYAEKCTLEAAMLLSKAAFQEFYNEPKLNIKIERIYADENL